MTGDILVTYDNTQGAGDWSIAGGDFATGSPIVSALMVSLFTDARAPDDWVPPKGVTDRRGWWGDTYLGPSVGQAPFSLGSRLWMYERASKSARTNLPVQIRQAVQDALQWMTDDGVAASVGVVTGWLSATAIGVQIQVTEPNGQVTDFQYSWAWNGI